MDEKERKLVDAAIGAFVRYGVRKTTMADIAEAAGVSRQTLYASFANKDEVLVVAIHHLCDQTLEAVRAGWASADGLSARLDVYFEHAILAIYRQIRAAPDSDDMVTGFSEAGRQAVEDVSDIKPTNELEASVMEQVAAFASNEMKTCSSDFACEHGKTMILFLSS